MEGTMSVFRKLSFASKISSRSAINVTQDSVISICTEEGIYILSPQNVPCQKNDNTVVHINKIPCPTEIKDFNVDIDRDAIQAQITDYNDSHDDVFQIMLDRTVSPALQSMQTFRGFTTAQWSPLGADAVGRSVLATLTHDHRLDIHSLHNTKHNWTKVLEVSEKFEQLMKQEAFYPAQQRLAQSGKSGSNDRIDTMKERTYLLGTVAMCWSPAFLRLVNHTSPKPPAAKKIRLSGSEDVLIGPNKQHCSYLAVAVKSGHISLWRANLPIKDQSDVTFCELTDLYNDVPSAICWCSQGQIDPGFVAVGYQCGLLKTVGLSWKEGSADLTTRVASELWPDKDLLAVSTLCWDDETCVLYMAKGPYLIALLLEMDLENNDWQVAQSARLTIGNQLPVTMIHLNKPHVYVGCLDDRIIRVKTDTEDGLKLSLGERISLVHEETGPNKIWKCHGIGTSPNNVFLYTASSPMWNYCHLTIKEALKVFITNLCTLEEVISLLLRASPSSSLDNYRDTLVFLKKKYITETDQKNSFQTESQCTPPPLFAQLIEDKALWPHLSIFRNKITRSLLQVELAYCPPKNTELQDLLKEDLKVVTNLIVMAHVRQTVSKLSITFTKGSPLTDAENTIFLLLGNVLSWNSQKEDSALARTAMQMAGVKGKPPGVVKESCIICMAEILLTDVQRATCSNGHSFGRCSQTLLACQDVPYRTCTNCGSLAIGKQLVTSSMKEILSNSCSLCDGWIV